MNELVKINNDLVPVNEAVLLDIFSSENGLSDVIKEARLIVEGFEHDISTKEGRKKTASLARKVASLKTRLDGMGKDLVSDWKKKAKAVDDNRKIMRDELDKLKEKARAPLTEWENVEKERVENLQRIVNKIKTFGFNRLNSSTDAEKQIKELEEIIIDENLQEYREEAREAKQESMSHLVSELERLKAHEEQQAEIERLRKEAAERERKENEERLQREAEERARIAAERKAQAEIERAKEERLRAQMREEQAQKEREEAIKRAEEQARLAEQRRIAAEEKAKQDAIKAAEEAKQEQIRLQREKEEAEQAELLRRQRDKEHAQRIRAEAKESLMILGFSEQEAIKIVANIHNKKVLHVSISY